MGAEVLPVLDTWIHIYPIIPLLKGIKCFPVGMAFRSCRLQFEHRPLQMEFAGVKL